MPDWREQPARIDNPYEPVDSSAAAIAAQGETLLAGCGGQTAIAIQELQLEGKRRMSAREFLNGYHPTTGERLGC